MSTAIPQKAALALAVILLLANGSTPPAGATAADGITSLITPNGFEVQGSNGYTIFVVGQAAFRGRGPMVDISVHHGNTEVFYSAPATLTKTSIQADLGELGEISVSFHPDGETKTVRTKCTKQSFSFESGNFEGEIDFHGEDGYTDVEATSAPGIGETFDICTSRAGGGGGRFPRRPPQGADLYLRTPGLGPAFDVVKRRPGAAPNFYIALSEYRSGISIRRYMELHMPANSFLFDRSLRMATVRPPAPFSGSATYDRRRRANRRWQGDLAVDLPGKPGIPLTGRQFRAYLVPH